MLTSTNNESMFNKDRSIITHCSMNATGVYNIPYAVKQIGIQAFFNCKRLTHVFLPQGLEIINMFAFENCFKLTTITIPPTVKSINFKAFCNCLNLKSVTVGHLEPLSCDAEDDIFSGVDLDNCTLYVPTGSKEIYAKKTVWYKFRHIVEIGINETIFHVDSFQNKNDTKNTLQPKKQPQTR